jgi:hypothetical protein
MILGLLKFSLMPGLIVQRSKIPPISHLFSSPPLTFDDYFIFDIDKPTHLTDAHTYSISRFFRPSLPLLSLLFQTATR